MSDCATFGKLRFPDAPAFCGRLPVATAEQDDDQVIITTPRANDLRDGDHVDFSAVPGLAGNLEVTVTDNLTFTVTGTLSAPYTSGGYIKITNAPDYAWNDSDPKGEFLVITWDQNLRQVGERNRLISQFIAWPQCPENADPGPPIRANQALHGMPAEVSGLQVLQRCLPFTVEDPQVIGASPNFDPDDEDTIDNFRNGLTLEFAADAIVARGADDRYGFRWQGAVMQHLEDPLWQTPHRPCTPDPESGACRPCSCSWLEDIGFCPADDCRTDNSGDQAVETGYRLYPQRPWVEARNTLPTGSPALPAGIHINILTLDQLAATAGTYVGQAASEVVEEIMTDGLVIPPPIGPGMSASPEGGAEPWAVLTSQTPWGIYGRQCYCTCLRPSRWGALYQTNAVCVHCPPA